MAAADFLKDVITTSEHLEAVFPEPPLSNALVKEIGVAFIKWDHNRDLHESGVHAQTAALYRLLDDPNVTVDELLQDVQGPDFPTGGIMMGRSGVQNAYRSGRGAVTVRGKYHVEERNKRKYVIFTEVPYQVRTNTILERIAHLATLRQDAPMASMTLVLPDADFTGFLVHVSRLAWHTQDMAKDPHVALSIADMRAPCSLAAFSNSAR